LNELFWRALFAPAETKRNLTKDEGPRQWKTKLNIPKTSG